ncbi:disabled homolog 2 isoform X5 [Esox lucius]|uniref:disabled homolog 2 isoform X5 n=1 Tax=Esox lucius TaxID=8010 RepID=UPI0014771A0B|nr:disabled homolog 2 isoform X5 [Esox lucius]
MRQRADRSDIFNRLVNSSEQHIIMETDQESGKAAASCPAASQNPLKTGWQSSSKRGTSVTNPPCDVTCRFQGDGVRYKAKLIGMDFVPVAQGEKTCLDSMMKLKGQEVAARNQGRHKQRVWLKVTAAAVTILDERTGLVIHSHEPGNIHSLTKDEYDPRALSYIYNDEGTHVLFYIKMANLADPVLDDIKEVCQSSITQGDQVTEVNNSLANSSALLLFDEKLASPKALDDMDQFSPIPASPSDQQQQISSKDELRDIFSVSSQNPCMNQQDLHCFPQGPPLFPSRTSTVSISSSEIPHPTWSASRCDTIHLTRLRTVGPAGAPANPLAQFQWPLGGPSRLAFPAWYDGMDQWSGWHDAEWSPSNGSNLPTWEVVGTEHTELSHLFCPHLHILCYRATPAASLSNQLHVLWDRGTPAASLSNQLHVLWDRGTPAASLSNQLHVRWDRGTPAASLSN